jgi:hypothetical protein
LFFWTPKWPWLAQYLLKLSNRFVSVSGEVIVYEGDDWNPDAQ